MTARRVLANGSGRHSPPLLVLLSYGADVEDEARMKQPLKWSAFAVVAGVYALVLVVLLGLDEGTRDGRRPHHLRTLRLAGNAHRGTTVPRVTPKVPAILFVLGFVTQLAGGPPWAATAFGGAAFATIIVYLAQRRYRAP